MLQGCGVCVSLGSTLVVAQDVFDLRRGTWDFFFSFLSFLHVGSLVAVCELLAVACGIWLPDQGLNPGPHTGRTVLATGPPGKSQGHSVE